LHLEGKMAEVLHKLAKKKTVIAVADGLSDTELRKLNATIFDPHIWFSVLHWQKAMAFAAKQIALKDTLNADEYTLNANKYSNTLIELNRWVLQEIESLPENQKIMITAHDAFGYFGEAYHIKVRGLQGISTITEFGLKDITDLVNYIVENRVKAVFVESSVPTRAIDAVVEGCAAKGHQIKIGGTLYSDAMGAEGTPEGTYVGMVKSNVSKIVKGLK
jgi:manganese/zinc/iron transport system substrate-binding protein